MTKTHKLRPWHEVVRLKQHLRTGELSLAQFAADLHGATLAQAQRPVYENRTPLAVPSSKACRFRISPN